MNQFLPFLALAYPDFDPVLVALGPLEVRWYSLAYIVGLIGGWWWLSKVITQSPKVLNKEQLDDVLLWVLLGVVLGGRVGYVLFYQFDYYLDDPLSALRVWEGGMSFHGGMLGVILGGYLFARKHGIRFLALMDLFALVVPIGLGFGRLANFINGELVGRATDVPWAMVFPHVDWQPRHPSQLYEALGEGLILLLLMLWAMKAGWRDVAGRMGGLFLAGYGVARFLVEYVREPDVQLGLQWLGLTQGQWLTIPMIALGVWLMFGRIEQRKAAAA